MVLSNRTGTLAWATCLAYGLGSLLWFGDYARRVLDGADRETLRRSLAGGAAAFVALTGSALVLLFCSVLSALVVVQ